MTRSPPGRPPDDSATLEKMAIHLGDRLRVLRHARNLNQAELGCLIEVTAQQIHRYERGKSAISAISLWRLSRALDAPIGYFFDDFGDDRPALPPPAR